MYGTFGIHDPILSGCATMIFSFVRPWSYGAHRILEPFGSSLLLYDIDTTF